METRRTTRGFGISSLVPHDIVRELAPAAEATGFSMLWVNDLLGSSGLASLGVAAEAAPSLDLGVGVLAVDRWDGRQVADAVEAAGIVPDRLTVGIGAGQLTVGAHDAVRRAAAGLAELGARRVVVGSLGPRMTRLGGSDADGVLLNWVTPAAAGTLDTIAREGASGRGAAAWTATYTRVASDATAGERLAAECAAYERYPAYGRHFRRFGVTAMDTSVIGDRGEIVNWLGGFDGVVDHVVARAIAAEETLDGYLDVLRASAPGTLERGDR